VNWKHRRPRTPSKYAGKCRPRDLLNNHPKKVCAIAIRYSNSKKNPLASLSIADKFHGLEDYSSSSRQRIVFIFFAQQDIETLLLGESKYVIFGDDSRLLEHCKYNMVENESRNLATAVQVPIDTAVQHCEVRDSGKIARFGCEMA